MRHNLLHLTQVDQEGTMAAHNHRIGREGLLHLLGGGAQHVGMHLVVAQMADLDVVSHRLDI